MFYRNAIESLRKWAKRDDRKPLVLRGARQVGKTTLVEEFAREFEVFLQLNLDNDDDAILFEQHTNIDKLLTAIYLHNNKPKTDAPTLLFIDEIQNSPRAVAQLRYFYERRPEIHVIAAGSLLESLIDRQISFPVGRVEYMALRPCSFNEFLGALGETELQKAQLAGQIPDGIHQKVINLFNQYTLVGGMPEVVAHYAKHHDVVALQNKYETLLTGYRDDVEKYASEGTTRNVIRHILDAGWVFASQRIKFERFGNSNYRSREVGEAFRLLEKTMLLELSYSTTSYNIPIASEPKRSPKLLWVDTGIVNYSAGLQKELFGMKDISDAWRGKIAEHIVGQELLASDSRVSRRRHFWVRDAHGADAEVDYVVQVNNHVIPVEVKSGNNAKLRSLHLFMENAGHDTAVRFWSGKFSVDRVTTTSGKSFNLFNMPYYYAGIMNDILFKNSS